MRGETLIFVCFYGWVVCPLKTGLYKGNGRSARVTPGHTRPPGRLPTRKNTQKSKFLRSQAFKWKKIMFFVIPEMQAKTFVMLYKKLSDHFKYSLFVEPRYADHFGGSFRITLVGSLTLNLSL